ncbi:MAG: DUF58 domain-containing protein [Planctomycetota bacterium]
MANRPGTIDPKVLDRLSGLELVARRVVEGFMAGTHASPQRGSSVEFAQHRPYAPGDETRRLDWKVFARSDRLVVKEYVEETNLSLNLLIDASESMAFSTQPWSKFDYARWCAAALAHLVLAQRDTAGLVVFDEAMRAKVPPGNGAPQELAILKTLEQTTPSGPTNVGKVIQLLAPRLRHRGVTAVFSDFFDEPAAIVEGVRRLVHGGHEPILFQVLDPAELSFQIDGLVRLQGLEGAGDLKIDPRAIREAYIEEIQNHNKELARQARALSVDFVQVVIDEPLDAVLSAYLTKRAARARSGGAR